MARIDEIKALCDRLAPLGWRGLLQAVTHATLDISQSTSSALQAELTKNLPEINRALSGFEDFAQEGDKAVAPAQPALSLLYHALASPLITRDHEGEPLQDFATAAELDLLEDFIFSLAPLPLLKFIQDSGGASNVAVAVFSCEYRPASDTVDGRHADLTFSRTGIARMGTARPRYHPILRGFWPEDEDNPNGIRVLPARFTAWLAIKKKGRDARVSPILESSEGQASDEPDRTFLIPVHKLFSGKDCIEGLDLDVELASRLFNVKIQRIHKALGADPLPDSFPYVIRDGEIADWSTEPNFGPGWLVPTARSRLVEPAVMDGKPLTFRVTPDFIDDFAAFEPSAAGVGRGAAPEYVHARTQVKGDRFLDLNDEMDVIGAMKKEPYDALHYVDFSGEGWVQANIPVLNHQNIAFVAAYALVCAPDFFPACGQFEVSEWSRSKDVPAQFHGSLWLIDPTPLSETRLPANLQLQDNPFTADDATVTAVVSMGIPKGLPAIWPQQRDVLRASSLPDDAAGVFAPGWDVGTDEKPGGDGVRHLAAYALGSPFPEDAKLCAALSTFWPAVAPDVFRTFATPIGNTGGTVAPLTDEEIGQSGSLPWDGIRGPRVVTQDGKRYVEIASFLNADYVRQVMQNRLSIRLTAQISAEDYQDRILAVSRAYSVVADLSDIKETRRQWLVLSFRVITSADVELQQAQSEAHTILRGPIYRMALCKSAPVAAREKINAYLHRFPLQDLCYFFTSPDSQIVLIKRENDLRWASASSEG
jgi:hypothetical protein